MYPATCANAWKSPPSHILWGSGGWGGEGLPSARTGAPQSSLCLCVSV
ncbi:MAG: hypothetical protein AVDCRST_MAG68-2952 [uncultured Gemmatimonadetes bacterium]|uniref:Uncharacterized protein n=1 Tax=uncultured Gemmatimonadota bacterium TaxID=203437 RepID=A0A6J4LSX9_9BACT|nr:MAG: hypothetical protein AVDCRST_MAG68-2952 [uncultured Gemmatimonadota bacterium]